MTPKSLLLGAAAIGTVAVLAGCGSSSAPSPTASGGSSLPSLPGLGSGTTGNTPSAPANTLLSLSDVQNISGDPNVAALSCSAATCIYADSANAGGGSGIVVIEPFASGIGQQALEEAVAAAIASGGGSSSGSGSSTTEVSGLGTAAVKEIDSDSATYAFFKDNYLVVIDVTSGTKSGADMDSQVEAAAQTAAGKL